MNTKIVQPFADAQAAMPFVMEQGRNIETRIYEKRYPTLLYSRVVPIITEGADWAIGTTFFTVDVTGQAKFLSGNGTDMPFNQATRDQASHDYAMIGSGWEWNLEEVNQAALYNLDLNASKAMGASQSIQQLLYDIAMIGSTEKGWKGFTNQSIVSRVDAAATGGENGGGGTSTYWAHKTLEEIMYDINTLGLEPIRTETNEIEWADTIALPPGALRDLSTRRLGVGDGMLTFLQFIRLNNIYTAETGQPLTIEPVRDLATASQDGGGRMVAYRKDPDVIRFHLPMPRRVLGVHQKSIMGFETGIIARTGGVEVRLPAAMNYVDEITAVPS